MILLSLNWHSEYLKANTSKSNIFAYGLSRTIQLIEQAGKTPIILLDLPELPFFPKDCIRGLNKDVRNCVLLKSIAFSRQNTMRQIIKKLQASDPKLWVYDPLPFFCNDFQCEWRTKNHILYKDSHHLSYAGSVYYAQYFIPWLFLKLKKGDHF